MGVDVKFTSHADEVLDETEKMIQRALNAVGLQMERNAKTEINKLVYDTPPSPTYKRTGRLRASITYATKTKHGNPKGKQLKEGDSEVRGEPADDTVYVGTNVEYAPYVEFGTKKMTARPFLKYAVANHIPEYKEIIQGELGESMKVTNVRKKY